MTSFIQYHNAPRLGWVPFDERPFLDTRLSIVTRRPAALRAVGATVYLIVSLAAPKRYYLWERFVIDRVELREGLYCAEGEGWQLAPPARLAGPAFEAFKAACANFIGFRSIDGLPYRAVLEELSERHRCAEVGDEAEAFAAMLMEALPGSADGWFARGYVRLRRGDGAGARADLAEVVRAGGPHAEAARRYLG